MSVWGGGAPVPLAIIASFGHNEDESERGVSGLMVGEGWEDVFGFSYRTPKERRQRCWASRNECFYAKIKKNISTKNDQAYDCGLVAELQRKE